MKPSSATPEEWKPGLSLLYQNLFDNSYDGIMLTAPDGKIFKANPAATEILGYTEAEIIALGRDQLIDITDPRLPALFAERAREGRVRGELTFIGRAGKRIPAEFYSQIYKVENGEEYSSVIFRDMSERKAAEDKLRASEEKYRSLVESADAAISLIAQDGTYLYLNQIAAGYLGRTPEQMIGKAIFETVPSRLAIPLMADITLVITDNQGKTLETKTTLEGKPIWFRTSIQPVINGTGKPYAALVFSTDITRSKEAEEALRQSEKRYRQLFEVHGLPKLIIDPQTWQIVDANKAAGEFYGYEVTVLKGMRILEFVPAQVPGLREKLEQEEQLISFEVVHRAAGSDLRNVEVFSGPVEIDGKRLLFSIITDVTEKHRAQAELKEAYELLEKRVTERTAELEKVKNRMEAIFSHSGEAILMLDTGQGIQQANYTFEQLFDTKPENYLNRKLEDFLRPEDRANFEATVREVITTHQKCQIEAQTGDGKIQVEISLAPVNRSGNAVTSLVGIIRDITIRKLAETRLREAEELFRTLFEALPDAVMVTDDAGHYLKVNSAACRLLGYTREEFLKLTTDNYINLSSERILDLRKQFINRGFWQDEFELKTRDGRSVLCEARISLINIPGLKGRMAVAVFQDITERKRAEQLVRESEERYRLLAENVQDVIIRLSPDDLHTFVTPSIFELLGYTPEELIGRPGYELVYPDDRLKAQETFHQALESGVITFNLTHRALHKDGHSIWVELNNTVVYEPSGTRPVEIISIIHDITKRKQAEDELVALSRRLQLATEAGEIGTWEWDARKDELFWDDQMLNFYGITRDEFKDTLMGYWGENLMHPDDRDRVQKEFAEALAGLKPLDTEFRINVKSGGIRYLKARCAVLRDEKDQPVYVVGINWDITLIKQAQENLQQALEKELELGELKSRFVSMASHEFRTPLSSILATAEILINYRSKMNYAQIDARLEKIKQQVLYLKVIIDEVLQLSRMQAGRVEFRPVTGDLNQLCQEIIEEFENHQGNQGRIAYTCAFPPVGLDFDPYLMRGIINNLLSNALKYSPQEKGITVELNQESGEIRLRVKDEGIGIPEEDFKHLFEPFHRAGNVGSIAGTGLGLSITSRSVEMHGGKLIVQSQENIGTTMTVILPATGGAEEALPPG